MRAAMFTLPAFKKLSQITCRALTKIVRRYGTDSEKSLNLLVCEINSVRQSTDPHTVVRLRDLKENA